MLFQDFVNKAGRKLKVFHEISLHHGAGLCCGKDPFDHFRIFRWGGLVTLQHVVTQMVRVSDKLKVFDAVVGLVVVAVVDMLIIVEFAAKKIFHFEAVLREDAVVFRGSLWMARAILTDIARSIYPGTSIRTPAKFER